MQVAPCCLTTICDECKDNFYLQPCYFCKSDEHVYGGVALSYRSRRDAMDGRCALDFDGHYIVRNRPYLTRTYLRFIR